MPFARTDLPHSGPDRHPLHDHEIALRLLLDAHACAQELGCDPWKFAVEIDQLHADGVTNTRLRWLLHKGYIAHGFETTDGAGQQRSFQAVAHLGFQPRSCFVLTDAGRALTGDAALLQYPVAGANGAAAQPCWDASRRELRVGEVLVKRFRQQAPNQELILQVFAEEGWPVRIDDPLPPAVEQGAKRRLHDTICNLNRGHARPLIRFEGGGDGQSVCWQLAHCLPAATPHRRQCDDRANVAVDRERA
jgi:hypothetical protein